MDKLEVEKLIQWLVSRINLAKKYSSQINPMVSSHEPSKTSGSHTPNLGNTPKTKNKNTQ